MSHLHFFVEDIVTLLGALTDNGCGSVVGIRK